MKTSWSALKQLIGNTSHHPSLFLTVIDPIGRIQSANSTMLREMELSDPKVAAINFFDLVHPSHRFELKNALADSCNTVQSSVELHLKNGHYHPMRWQINSLHKNPDGEKKFLCVGYKLAEDSRIEQFSQLLENNCHHIIEGLSGLVFHDINGELIAANQMAANLFETTLESMYQLRNIRKRWNNEWIIQNENGQPVPFEETAFMLAIRTGEPQKQVLGVRLDNGKTKWILFNSQPFKSSE